MDESELRTKYGTCVIKGSLKPGRGRHSGKNVVILQCKCGSKILTATSDIFQRVCPDCGEKISRKKGGRS